MSRRLIILLVVVCFLFPPICIYKSTQPALQEKRIEKIERAENRESITENERITVIKKRPSQKKEKANPSCASASEHSVATSPAGSDDLGVPEVVEVLEIFREKEKEVTTQSHKESEKTEVSLQGRALDRYYLELSWGAESGFDVGTGYRVFESGPILKLNFVPKTKEIKIGIGVTF